MFTMFASKHLQNNYGYQEPLTGWSNYKDYTTSELVNSVFMASLQKYYTVVSTLQGRI